MKQPPFSKLADRHAPAAELRIYVGDNPQAWDVCRLRNGTGPAVLLPAGEVFSQYDWPVHGRDVLLLQVEPFDDVPGFAAYLLKKGAQVVRVLHGSRIDTYRAARA